MSLIRVKDLPKNMIISCIKTALNLFIRTFLSQSNQKYTWNHGFCSGQLYIIFLSLSHTYTLSVSVSVCLSVCLLVSLSLCLSFFQVFKFVQSARHQIRCVPCKEVRLPPKKGCTGHDTKLYPVVSHYLQRFRECGVHLHYYYSQIHSGPEQQHLLWSLRWA